MSYFECFSESVELFSRLERAVFRGVYGEIFAFFQACVGNFDTIPQWKVVGTLYLDSSYVTFKYFAFLSICDKFELLGHIRFASLIISSRIASIDIGQQKLAKTDPQHKKISEFLTSTWSAILLIFSSSVWTNCNTEFSPTEEWSLFAWLPNSLRSSCYVTKHSCSKAKS